MKKLLLTIVMSMCVVVCTWANVVHVVEPGETLKSIAKKYGLTEAQIVELNPDAGQFVYVGMELNIPVDSPVKQNASANVSTVVVSGQESIGASSATEHGTRVDSDGNVVYYPSFFTVNYQTTDVEFIKESGSYGLGLVYSSFSHWGRFHVGANVNFSINAGLIDDWGCIIEFGPSVRFDISDRCFINMPIDAVCSCTFPEGTTDTKTDWGAKISPAIHGFLTDRFGLFAGPQVALGSGKTNFGAFVGICYAF